MHGFRSFRTIPFSVGGHESTIENWCLAFELAIATAGWGNWISVNHPYPHICSNLRMPYCCSLGVF